MANRLNAFDIRPGSKIENGGRKSIDVVVA